MANLLKNTFFTVIITPKNTFFTVIITPIPIEYKKYIDKSYQAVCQLILQMPDT